MIQSAKIMNLVCDYIEVVLKECLNENVRYQIKQALKRNEHFTSCYSLQVNEVQDIKGKTSKDSGWYIILSGTRTGIRFFINNDLEICRRPDKRKTRICNIYDFTNWNNFSEGFWMENF